jgi:hypothetical protein
MRETMSAETDARVLMGGKVSGYAGKYPGLLEEAYLALRASKPLYLLGAFGGCTRAVIELVEGGGPESLTLDFQCRNEGYRRLVEEYNARAAANPVLGLEPVDYEAVGRALSEAGVEGLRNGLSPEENRRLFHAVDPDELVHLVLKGLSNVRGGR